MTRNNSMTKKTLSKKRPLDGDDIRYLRTVLELSQKSLGKILGVDYQSIARWEKSQTSISRAADFLLRVYSYSYFCLADARPIFQIIKDLSDIMEIAKK